MGNTERRIAAAVEALRDKEAFGDVFPEPFGLGIAEAVAAAAIRAADAVDEVRLPGHVLEIREESWGLQHPAECRPNLLDCDVDRRVHELAAHGHLSVLNHGRYIAGLTAASALRVEPLPVSAECQAADHHKCPGGRPGRRPRRPPRVRLQVPRTRHGGRSMSRHWPDPDDRARAVRRAVFEAQSSGVLFAMARHYRSHQNHPDPHARACLRRVAKSTAHAARVYQRLAGTYTPRSRIHNGRKSKR